MQHSAAVIVHWFDSGVTLPSHGQVGTLEGVYHFALAEDEAGEQMLGRTADLAGEHMPERTAALAGEKEVLTELCCSSKLKTEGVVVSRRKNISRY